MHVLLMGALKVLKGILLSMLSERFMKWVLFWIAGLIVESTKTTKDDEFLAKVKDAYEHEESNK